jgi:ABC-2 type transport system ATP-binding protein
MTSSNTPRAASSSWRLRTPGALAPLLAADGVTLTSTDAGRFEVRGLTADVIGDIAAGHGLRLHELAPRAASLESAYLELTRDSVEFAAA